MKLELLSEIVNGIPGVKKDGAAALIPDDNDFALYVGLAAEVLTIARLAKITLGAEVISLETHKGEKYFFAPQDVVGARLLPAKDGGAGGRSSAGFR